MEHPDAEYLLKKYNHGLCSDYEKSLVETWFLNETKDIPNYLPEPDYGQVKERIWMDIQDRKGGEEQNLILWPRIVAIAGAIALILLGIYFFSYKNGINTDSNILVKQGVTPGKVNATLTLADGRKIKLSDAENGVIAREAGIRVTKTADGQLVYEMKENIAHPNKINTLSTARGETYQIRLPDGSMVWLNSASSLTYSTALNDKYGTRRVTLDGEGYFEIAKDKAHPFVVENKGQEVEVLGTHFNINAYSEEDVLRTTLVEGLIKVNNQVVLKPGQQSILKNSKIEVVEADVKTVMAWKNGQFIFDGNNFEQTMNMIARWYDVEIIYDYKPVNLRLAGQVSRSRSITEVLKKLQEIDEVKFKIEGRRIRVIK